MSASSPARLAFAAAAVCMLGFAPAAQAATVLANVAGTVVGAVVANKLLKGKNRSANCRLYDRDGREVYLPCDANRPLGDVVYADGSAAYAPQAYAEPSYAQQPYAAAYPVQGDCDCLPANSGYTAGYGQAYGGATAYGGAYGYQDNTRWGEGFGYWDSQDAYGYGGGYPYNGAPVVANVAGRDELGFLTWAGKRGR